MINLYISAVDEQGGCEGGGVGECAAGEGSGVALLLQMEENKAAVFFCLG